MSRLYDFASSTRHDGTESELWDTLTDCLWEICVLCEILGLDYNDLVQRNREDFEVWQEQEIRTTEPELWLDLYFQPQPGDVQ